MPLRKPSKPRPPSAKKEIADLTAKGRLVGWREWVDLPELGLARLRAKVDTGARTSAIHAIDVETFDRKGDDWVRFHVAPDREHPFTPVFCEAPVLDERDVKNTSGIPERRLTIRTALVIGKHHLTIDLTLADRSEMGFRMLIGRTAMKRGRLLVHPSRSFLQGEPEGPPKRKGSKS